VLGRGGIAAVSRASGISPNTIQKGMGAIESGERLTRGRVCVGLVVGAIRSAKPIRSWLWRSSDWSRRTVAGDPMQVLLWTSRSVRKLEVELRELGFDVHFTTVAHVLRSPRVQPAVQSQAPGGFPASRPRPAVSPDQRGSLRRSRRAAGDFDRHQEERARRRVREHRPGVAGEGRPAQVSTHDFPSQAVGKAILCGMSDISANEGFVNVAITAETARLALASIRAWWQDLGHERYPADRRCRSPPNAAAATATAFSYGSPGRSSWPTTLA
jgi:hypothetical protein